MLNLKTILAISLSIFTVACAASPESIAPSYVSHLLYDKFDCDQLKEEYIRVGHALDDASAKQRQARSDDIAGVLFLGIPVSGSSGENVAHQVARMKGEKQTIEQVVIKKKCNIKEEQEDNTTSSPSSSASSS